ncbi:MAG: DNA polymerase III subunit chi [Stagnimonas sp.]|nr:DNA polymerase III subunit chi [Stagnimonas sp.]
MTRVDFYILPEQGGTDPLTAAAKLCDKAVAAGHRLYVTAGAARLDQLSDLLWTLRQGSFLAQERYLHAAPVEPLPQVLLGEIEPPEAWHDILLTLSPEVPAWFSRFERVLEIVPGDPDSRARCRERFKFYRDRGYELKSFEQTPEGGWVSRK